jgi:YHS domain-containing protein
VESLLYFLLWAAVIVAMMRFGCGAHVLGHGHRGSHASQESDGGAGRLRWAAPATARDPVCAMTVATDRAKSTVYDGDVYYFCSSACRDKFEAAPRSYVASQAVSDRTMEHHHD